MTTPFPPRCAAKFEAKGLIARGGFGQVWLAEHRELKRAAAVKLLTPGDLDDDASTRRFLDEARVTASLKHPGIVVVLDHDIEDGVPWIAYEHLPGRTLRAYLDEAGRLDADALVPVARQLASALEAVHAAHIQHRDIKPENVIEAAPGLFKLADFGIAKWTASRVKTRTGVVLGTPSYIAPELIDGGAPTAASDLYAFGCVLFELAHGAPPFVATTLIEILKGHLEQVPLRLDKLVPGTPAPLADLIAGLLAKRPAERPASATAVCDVLDRMAAGEPSHAASAGPLTPRAEAIARTVTVARTARDPARKPAAGAAATRPFRRPGTRALPIVWIATISLVALAILIWRQDAQVPLTVASAESTAGPAATLAHRLTALNHRAHRTAHMATPPYAAAFVDELLALSEGFSSEVTPELARAALNACSMIPGLATDRAWRLRVLPVLEERTRAHSGFLAPLLLAVATGPGERATQLRRDVLDELEPAILKHAAPSDAAQVLWFDQIEALAIAQAGRGTGLLTFWMQTQLTVFEHQLGQHGDAAEHRRQLGIRLGELAGLARDELPRNEPLTRDALLEEAAGLAPRVDAVFGMKDVVRRHAEVARLGPQAVSWCRRASALTPPVVPTRPVERAAYAYLRDELEAGRSDNVLGFDSPDLQIAQYLRAVDSIDAMRLLLFAPVPGSDTEPLISRLRSLIARGRPMFQPVGGHARALVTAWRKAAPAAWGPRFLFSAVLDREAAVAKPPGSVQPAIAELEQAFAAFEALNSPADGAGFVTAWYQMVSELGKLYAAAGAYGELAALRTKAHATLGPMVAKKTLQAAILSDLESKLAGLMDPANRPDR